MLLVKGTFNMGIFFKTPKPAPRITVEGIVVTFDQKSGAWTFTYRCAEFCSFGSAFTLPTKMELDFIIELIETLKPEMRARLEKGLREWGGSRLDDGEDYSIDVESFSTDRTFTISWSSGLSWGDLIVDFIIKDREIADESWSD